MTVLCATVGLSALLAPALVTAQVTAESAPPETTASSSPETSIAEVVVTARRVQEDLQKVPATVTAISSNQLRQQNITDAFDLASTTPSLSVDVQFNSLLPNYAIRGLATGVTTYFSDAPCCGGTANTPFLDVSSVQVLNGPQGTLFGRSSAAGAVLIDPQHPDLSNYGGLFDATIGTYRRAQVTGVVNIPIIEDHLAIRLDVNANHVDGYTSEIGSNVKLDGVGNEQFRVGVEYKNGRFDNYLVGSYLNVAQSDSSGVLAAANPNLGIYNLSAAGAQAEFGAVCAQAVSLGFSPNAAACISQRQGLLSNIKATMQSELARVAGGGSAIRETLAPFDGTPQIELEHHGSIVDIARYDFGKVGFLNLDVKNIFSFDAFTDDTAGLGDGLGGVGEISGAFTTGNIMAAVGSNNTLGSHVIARLGPPALTYTDEIQVHGEAANGLVVGTVGAFYSYEELPKDLDGTANIYQLFSGALTPNLGFNSANGFSDGGFDTEVAVYTQETINLDKVGVHGLSLTGGYRFTWDHSTLTTLPANVVYPAGTFVPGATPSTDALSTSGYNFTFSVQEQVNRGLMFYVTVARAYVPGGLNENAQTSQTGSLPDFAPTFGPETVLEEEFGVKSDFHVGGVAGRIDADIYNNSFSDIAESFTGEINGASIVYEANIAAATLRGFEMSTTIVPSKAWEFRLTYNYNDAYYTKWIGQDPFNVATPGSPGCLPSSPAGLCELNLANNPFPFMPPQQAHITVVYHAPIDPAFGDLAFSATGYAQTREYYEPDAARDLQLFPGGLNGVSQAPYATLNLRVDWTNIRNSGWNAAVYATNVTNTIYALGKTPQLETLGFSIANYAPPRMIAFEIWKRFGP
jgi:iron complex outermembrane recepter protein